MTFRKIDNGVEIHYDNGYALTSSRPGRARLVVPYPFFVNRKPNTIISSKVSSIPYILHLHSIESEQDVGLTMIGKTLVRGFEY